MAIVARRGHVTAVRLTKGAVLLDARSGRIVELREGAAVALDFVFFDRAVRLPATEREAHRMRRVLVALRRELAGDMWSAPTRDLEAPRVRLRRHAEPPEWKSATVLPFDRSTDAAVLRLGLLERTGAEVVAMTGRRTLVASVTRAFPKGGTAPSEVTLEGREAMLIRTPTDKELRPIEFWTLRLGRRADLVRHAVSPAQALVRLLAVAPARPSEIELLALSACAERIPHFIVFVPRDPQQRARCVGQHFRALA